ncbi:hypothetical protein [Actinoplanes auranticolor]|nr:hypothetical protein [Actinoplanes auranticolor]
MAYLIPPMEDETPPEFIAFVAARHDMLLGEAARLTGGERSAPELCMQVLTDLAGRWRWLTWISRLTRRDAAAQLLDRRLTARTRQWREDQIYPVEVQVLRDHDQSLHTVAVPSTATVQYERPPAPAHESVAQQLAALLPSTVRAGTGVIAEAEIAWVHAYRRYLWRRYCTVGGGMVFLIGGMVQFMSQFSATT